MGDSDEEQASYIKQLQEEIKLFLKEESLENIQQRYDAFFQRLVNTITSFYSKLMSQDVHVRPETKGPSRSDKPKGYRSFTKADQMDRLQGVHPITPVMISGLIASMLEHASSTRYFSRLVRKDVESEVSAACEGGNHHDPETWFTYALQV
jgi:hypothetical protein